MHNNKGESTELPFKIMTFNIHHGRGTDGRLDLARIAELISATGAHMIGLNEVDCCFGKRSDYVDQAAWLAEKLGMDVAFGPAITRAAPLGRKERHYGNALLSRFPITSSTNHRFSFEWVESRAVLETSIRIGERDVNVYVTHLSIEPYTHRKQTKAILRIVQASRSPVIVLGDWNMSPRTVAWRHVCEHLTDVWDESDHDQGEGSTFPSTRPTSRLDYIFVSPDFRILATEVVHTIPEASDHLPLAAVLELKSVST